MRFVYAVFIRGAATRSRSLESLHGPDQNLDRNFNSQAANGAG